VFLTQQQETVLRESKVLRILLELSLVRNTAEKVQFQILGIPSEYKSRNYLKVSSRREFLATTESMRDTCHSSIKWFLSFTLKSSITSFNVCKLQQNMTFLEGV